MSTRYAAGLSLCLFLLIVGGWFLTVHFSGKSKSQIAREDARVRDVHETEFANKLAELRADRLEAKATAIKLNSKERLANAERDLAFLQIARTEVDYLKLMMWEVGDAYLEALADQTKNPQDATVKARVEAYSTRFESANKALRQAKSLEETRLSQSLVTE